ncbi:uncharacterized protein LOC135955509 [Calliphora vicina]|uniref:uncharacterized protein LOC135955509 n=1 Tax=Calliphora vicina TaxID=7373 RepID=UPI00325A985B
MSEVRSERRETTWSLSRQLEDLDYAEDICLLSHKISNMQAKIDDLERLARNVGLEINIKNAMRINNVSTDNIMLQGQPVECVESFCYLGSTVSTNGAAETDVNNRLNKARAALGRLQPVWRNSQISRRTKLRIFNACVKSTLLYGSETPSRKNYWYSLISASESYVEYSGLTTSEIRISGTSPTKNPY